jgi:hypothetical protein
MYPPEDTSYRPMAVQRTLFLDHVDEAMASLILERLADSDARWARSSCGSWAAPSRRSGRCHGVRPPIEPHHDRGRVVPRPDDLPRREQWVTSLVDRLRQGDDGAYVNFLMDQGPAGVRAAYPPPHTSGWPPSRDMGPDQPVPEQPEHPALVTDGWMRAG